MFFSCFCSKCRLWVQIINFIVLSYFPYFIRNSSHVALCHMTQLTNRNWRTIMAVMNDAQLSKDFGGLCLAKGILIFALSPAVFHSIAFSVVLSIYFAQKTNGI